MSDRSDWMQIWPGLQWFHRRAADQTPVVLAPAVQENLKAQRQDAQRKTAPAKQLTPDQIAWCQQRMESFRNFRLVRLTVDEAA